MRFLTTIYLLLLLYVIAALLFWGFSLERQNKLLYVQDQAALSGQVDKAAHPAEYAGRLKQLEERHDARKKQYIGEGVTFLLVILIGAAVVYTSIRRSIRLSRQQNNFMLSVTHELKSPIAGMKLSLQTIEKRVLTEEQRRQLITRCIQEADRLNDLCNNMLVTSQMEGRQYVPAREVISLSDMVRESVGAYAGRYPGRIEQDVEEGCAVTGDMLLLQMAIHNLLENAIKYTPAESVIKVCLKSQKGNITLQVADSGGGIPDEEKKKIFSKFYRIGDETTRKTKGTGLGLFLTARIVKQHKGRISLKDNKPKGALFEICLPALKQGTAQA